MRNNIMLPSSSSLFHYTKEKETFEKILSNGLMYSESVEYCPNEIIVTGLEYTNKSAFIVPMVCFCDIPISRTIAHRNTYGNYAIGFDKEFLRNKLISNLNPVNYVSSIDYANNISFLRSNVELKIKAFLEGKYQISYDEDKKIIDKELPIVNLFYSYFKPYRFYDEREWRAILPEIEKWNKTLINWQNSNVDIQGFINAYRNIRKPTNIFITLEKEELLRGISHIIIPKESDKPYWIDYILNENNTLIGCNSVPQNTRTILISNIISFERIEKDY